MQPLKLLNNVQKARLLHCLLIPEIPDFLSFLYEYSGKVLNSKEELAANWKDQLLGVDFWFELAEDARTKAGTYAKDLKKSSSVFAEQLFDGYTAIYVVHVLLQYTDNHNADIKFKQAVDFLFT